MERRESVSSSWSNDIEGVLQRIQTNCLVLSNYHTVRYHNLSGCEKYFKIPIIVLSAINSVFGVMMVKFTSQDIVSVFTSCVSLVVGVIGSIELYLGVNSKLTRELSSQKDIYTLGINIAKVLALDRCNRLQDGHQYLEEVFADYNKIITESNIKNGKIQDNLLQVNQVEVVVDSGVPTRAASNDEGGCI